MLDVFFRPLNLADIIEELERCESEIDVADIFIEPPEVNILSDEDSADEDDGGTVDNLTSRQLAANVEVVFSNNNRIGPSNDLELSFDVMPKELSTTQKSVIATTSSAGEFVVRITY